MTTTSYFRDTARNANEFTGRFPTVPVDGIPVFDGTAEAALTACLELTGTGGRVATANLDFLALARRDPQLRNDLRNSDLVIADGMPVVWLTKLAGARRIRRFAGVDLVAALFATERDTPLRVAIYGSTREIADIAVPALEALGGGGRVVHIANPPFRTLTDNELESDRRALAQTEPDIVLVALGCPAQERLIAEWQQAVPRAVWIGIGGTLDFFAGVRHRAPKFAQSAGLEWAVRMAQEPRRLGRRYLLRDLPALAAIAPGCARIRLTRTPRSDA